MGSVHVQPTVLNVPAGFTRERADARREFLRARLAIDSNGTLRAIPHAQQGSAVMSGLCWADGLIDVPAGATITEGSPVRYLQLAQLID
jgi:molybdopterin molybdotransferase